MITPVQQKYFEEKALDVFSKTSLRLLTKQLAILSEIASAVRDGRDLPEQRLTQGTLEGVINLLGHCVDLKEIIAEEDDTPTQVRTVEVLTYFNVSVRERILVFAGTEEEALEELESGNANVFVAEQTEVDRWEDPFSREDENHEFLD